MSTRTVKDGNAFYEIDEECERKMGHLVQQSEIMDATRRGNIPHEVQDATRRGKYPARSAEHRPFTG